MKKVTEKRQDEVVESTTEAVLDQQLENTAETEPDVEPSIAVEQESNLGVAKKRKIKFFTAGNIAVMGILTAISYILYLIPHFIPVFNLPIFPSWLDLQISDLPALLGGFAIGPWAAVIIIVVKCLLKMPFTSTTCVGELADIIIGIAFVVPAALFYRKWKNRWSAALGMLVGMLVATFVSVFANRFVLVPFYTWHFGGGNAEKGWNIILGVVGVLYKGVTKESFYKFYLWTGVLPFNLLRCAICAVITYLIYKPLSKALHWDIGKKKRNSENEQDVNADVEKSQDCLENSQDDFADTDTGTKIADTDSPEIPSEK